jgi:Domain of unknown function (DUF4149)
MIREVFRVLMALWAGSLWSVLWVTAILFNSQIDRHVAGLIAGRLFSIEAYIGLAVSLLAIMFPERRRYPLLYTAAAILSVNEWILKRAMNLAQTQGTAAGLSFGAWHGISAVLYMLACLSVVLVIYKDEYRHA